MIFPFSCFSCFNITMYKVSFCGHKRTLKADSCLRSLLQTSLLCENSQRGVLIYIFTFSCDVYNLGMILCVPWYMYVIKKKKKQNRRGSFIDGK